VKVTLEKDKEGLIRVKLNNTKGRRREKRTKEKGERFMQGVGREGKAQ